ncbi:MAG TPA: hypothetical protein VL201_01365 [Patescibacteria group bacterium]|nr:hypothetical protein [Patescibacteria group bacterium]
MKHVAKITALALIFFHQHALCMSQEVWKTLDKKTKKAYTQVKKAVEKKIQKDRFKKFLKTMHNFDDASYEQNTCRYDLKPQL